jgi:ferric-dicitrate binding protein FerR (iron transport regulator)
MSTPSESSSGEPASDDEIERLSVLARDLAAGANTDPRAPSRWTRLLDHRSRLARRARRRRLALASVTVLLIGLAGARLWTGRNVDVAYQLEGQASIVEGGYVHDVGGSGARLRFSEGTVVELAAGARAWVVSRDSQGARLRIEDGRAHFEVVHHEQARWSVDAGPFTIQVTGTSFDVRWTGAAEKLEISLARGSVIVRGPLTGAGVTLRPGQRLVAFLGQQTMRVEDASTFDASGRGGEDRLAHRERARGAVGPAGADAALTENGSAVRPAPAAPPSPSPLAPARGTGAARSHPSRERAVQPESVALAVDRTSWPRRVADGDFLDVLAEAERRGVEDCIASCSVEALAALADAARYGGRRDLARRLLLASRDRFPGTAPARAAAFLLGRMADGAVAIDWYDRYLAESPEGVYAAEALGRKMMAIDRLGDRPRARRIAAEYRSRFPAGAYLPQATALLQHP